MHFTAAVWGLLATAIFSPTHAGSLTDYDRAEIAARRLETRVKNGRSDLKRNTSLLLRCEAYCRSSRHLEVVLPSLRSGPSISPELQQYWETQDRLDETEFMALVLRFLTHDMLKLTREKQDRFRLISRAREPHSFLELMQEIASEYKPITNSRLVELLRLWLRSIDLGGVTGPPQLPRHAFIEFVGSEFYTPLTHE